MLTSSRTVATVPMYRKFPTGAMPSKQEACVSDVHRSSGAGTQPGPYRSLARTCQPTSGRDGQNTARTSRASLKGQWPDKNNRPFGGKPIQVGDILYVIQTAGKCQSVPFEVLRRPVIYRQRVDSKANGARVPEQIIDPGRRITREMHDPARVRIAVFFRIAISVAPPRQQHYHRAGGNRPVNVLPALYCFRR